jgi:hypothetical protein
MGRGACSFLLHSRVPVLALTSSAPQARMSDGTLTRRLEADAVPAAAGTAGTASTAAATATAPAASRRPAR